MIEASRSLLSAHPRNAEDTQHRCCESRQVSWLPDPPTFELPSRAPAQWHKTCSNRTRLQWRGPHRHSTGFPLRSVCSSRPDGTTANHVSCCQVLQYWRQPPLYAPLMPASTAASQIHRRKTATDLQRRSTNTGGKAEGPRYPLAIRRAGRWSPRSADRLADLSDTSADGASYCHRRTVDRYRQRWHTRTIRRAREGE